MAKMTQELIEKLYALGKNVYEKNEDIRYSYRGLRRMCVGIPTVPI